jgi:hypothetical protein
VTENFRLTCVWSQSQYNCVYICLFFPMASLMKMPTFGRNMYWYWVRNVQFLCWGKMTLPCYVTCNQCGMKPRHVLCVWNNADFSVPFCVVRAVHKFDFRLVTNEHLTNGNRYLLKKMRNAMIQIHVFDRTYQISPGHHRVNGLYPTLSSSTALSCVIL